MRVWLIEVTKDQKTVALVVTDDIQEGLEQVRNLGLVLLWDGEKIVTRTQKGHETEYAVHVYSA